MRQISTIIEIGTSKVVSIISEAGQYDDAHILGSAVAQYSGYKNRKWADKHSLARAINSCLRDAEKMAGRKIKNVHIGVPADFVKVVCFKAELEFPKHKTITQSDINELYQIGRSKLEVPKEYTLIHRCPVVFTLDGARRTMEPVSRKAGKISAVISYVFAEKWFVSGVSKILARGGFAPSTLVASSYAQAIRFTPQDKRDGGAIIIDIGANSTSVAVAKGDGLLVHQVFPFGSANITNDISKMFKVKQDLAEELKKRSIFGLSLTEDDVYEVCDRETYKFQRFSAQQVQSVIEARMLEMLKVISRYLASCGYNLPYYVPVYLTGGGASMRGLREFVQRAIQRNTSIISPQSTRFNQPCYASALAVMDLALEAETDDEIGFFENIKNLLGF
ncbi:MAG: cell division protein FtsA [Clostridia bacterium]|nr:cell division protein FtsA [Clostridia bacterium]